MNIMLTKPRIVPFWWMAWIALMLFLFSLSSVTARFLMLPGDSVRLALLEGETLDVASLDRLEASRLRVVRWFSPASVAGDLAVLSLQRAQGAASEEEGAAFAEAEKWQRIGLLNAPADPYGWFRLAFLFYRTEGSSAQAAKAWSQSLDAAPYEPRLSFARLQMAMTLDPFLDDNARRHIPVLIRSLVKDDPKALATGALVGAYVSVVEEALVNEDDDLITFREHVSKLVKKSK
ncbi:MAG TPA: hypothetical protein DD400_02115 [Rhodospirillaceae bacterium]|nr:hypothetical protein [Rhodospirillaceae bacterium]